MRKIVIILLIPVLFVTCKKKEKFLEPDYIFGKWVKAIEVLNYGSYIKCEAFPKSPQVFREMYRDRYFADLMINEIEDLDSEDIHKDHEGNPFIKRNVTFECAEIRRADRKPVALLRGNVDFIRYTEGERKDEGWLMWNRSFIRVR